MLHTFYLPLPLPPPHDPPYFCALMNSISIEKSPILKKAKQPYFVCNMKNWEKPVDADFDVFEVRRAVCKEERTTTAGFVVSSGAQKVCKAQSCDAKI